jgi:hypothetical protein
VREELRVGLHGVEAATVLHRVHAVHPAAGLLEAADLRWWWRTPRPTDVLPQLLGFDQHGRPEAAVIAPDWGDGIALDPIVLPGASDDWVVQVIERGLLHTAECGFGALDVVADRADGLVREVLDGPGVTAGDDGPGGGSSDLSDVDAWPAADARPPASRVHGDRHDGCRLASCVDTAARPHHMIRRSGPDVEQRQTSLNRPDLDLLLLDRRDRVAASGLFWFDPDTAVGLVEPMRTEDDHQRRGLARTCSPSAWNCWPRRAPTASRCALDATTRSRAVSTSTSGSSRTSRPWS